MRREYQLKVVVNGKTLNRVSIDDHYQAKHSDTMNDSLILELVKTMNGKTYFAEKITPSGWEVFAVEPLHLEGKAYRLIWCLHSDEDELGVINAFRRRSRRG